MLRKYVNVIVFASASKHKKLHLKELSIFLQNCAYLKVYCIYKFRQEFKSSLFLILHKMESFSDIKW